MYKASVCFDFTIFNVIVKPIKHYNVSEYVCTCPLTSPSDAGAGQDSTPRHFPLFQKEEESKMSSLAIGDYSTIAEMDPSVADGFRVIYDREVGGFQPTPIFIAFWLFILLVVASCRKNTPNLNCISIFLSLPTQHDHRP